MEEPPTTDRAVSLDEAISIAIRLQQSDQWVAAGDMYRRILGVGPDYPDAVHYSGVLAHQEGRTGRSRPVRAYAGSSPGKECHDELVKRELTAYLRDAPGAFDVIVSAADTLVYFGPLQDVVVASADALRPGGRLIFTVEELSDAGSDAGYAISPHGRYSHTRQYLERVLADANLRPEIMPAELRLEAGDPVAGLVVRATKPPACLEQPEKP
jgi:hypothetical protein